MLYRFGKIRDGFIRVAMLNPLTDTMVQVAFQNDLANLLQCTLCRIDLPPLYPMGYKIFYHVLFVPSTDSSVDQEKDLLCKIIMKGLKSGYLLKDFHNKEQFLQTPSSDKAPWPLPSQTAYPVKWPDSR